MFSDIPEFLDQEIEISSDEFRLTAKERGVIFRLNCKNNKHNENTILEYESTYSDSVVGAITYMKRKSEFLSVREKLEKLAVNDNQYIRKWLDENEEKYPLYYSYIMHIEKIRLMALQYIEEQLGADKEGV